MPSIVRILSSSSTKILRFLPLLFRLFGALGAALAGVIALTAGMLSCLSVYFGFFLALVGWEAEGLCRFGLVFCCFGGGRFILEDDRNFEEDGADGLRALLDVLVGFGGLVGAIAILGSFRIVVLLSYRSLW